MCPNTPYLSRNDAYFMKKNWLIFERSPNREPEYFAGYFVGYFVHTALSWKVSLHRGLHVDIFRPD